MVQKIQEIGLKKLIKNKKELEKFRKLLQEEQYFNKELEKFKNKSRKDGSE